ncbi:hypothetical protein, partial [Accumulibacter sp.]|uniref:hypothetical protein n=1 Tax=Accumulibacter sp. TaxID=2053492 RepID=UPI002C651590
LRELRIFNGLRDLLSNSRVQFGMVRFQQTLGVRHFPVPWEKAKTRPRAFASRDPGYSFVASLTFFAPNGHDTWRHPKS